MVSIGQPKIDRREAQHYVGIRKSTPMKGMQQAIRDGIAEVLAWLEVRGIERSGPPFNRFHVIDMKGMMHIETGVPVANPIEGDERVRPGMLPAGKYASLIYIGGGISGNKALIEWVRAQGLAFDRWDDPAGDAFASRYESYLTDPAGQPLKSKWEIEVAIKLKE
jgi:effector-binding domain-containing protein